VSDAIANAVASLERPAEDRERDAGSRPAEVLAFFGIGRGMRVLDLSSATGYFSELLSRIVGPDGHVIAHNHAGARAMLGPLAFERRYGNGRLPNVELLFAAHNELRLPPGSLDAAILSLVYHDTYWVDPKVAWGPVDQRAMLGALYSALVPGGVVGVIDHTARPGSDPSESAKVTHRIDRAVVIEDFREAGFELEARSDELRNTADDLETGVFDPAIRGRTDRFVLRFRRPDSLNE
jgi:predicted methyltransferase